MGKVVGILSMQRVPNYGSFLQAYALKQILLQEGADEVYFIDIVKGRSIPGYGMFGVWRDRIGRLILAFIRGNLIIKIRDLIFRSRLHSSIIAQFPTLGLDISSPSHYDVVFIGSDEVFNCCQKTPWGYTPQLYGRIPQADKIVSFAGSFGSTTYEQLLRVGIVGEIRNTMKGLFAISVRDQNSYEIVKKLTGIKPEINLDPVLIYGYQKEMLETKSGYQGPYMVIYGYQGRISNKNEINKIVAFAKSKSLKLFSLFCRYDWCDEAIIPDTPFDVLTWFKGAKFIITDTFHGTIFSIITRRPFCVLVQDSNKQKIYSLLEQLFLRERMISKSGIQEIDSIFCHSIDYDKVENILLKEREKAMRYIRKQLE